MPTNHARQVSEETPMSRNDLAVGAAIARLEAGHSHLGDRLDQGFERMDRQFESVNGTLGKLTDHLTTQDKTLQSLSESRDRQKKLLKWAGSVIATVVAALLLLLVGLK